MASLDPLLADRLRDLDRRGILRDPSDSLLRRAVAGAARLRRPLVDASSNDYLGFASLRVSRETAGAGASRLLNGTRSPHVQLEDALSTWLGVDAALLFSSGLAANTGLVQALAQDGDVIISDSLNHASLIDGCRLSRAEVRVVPHRDLDALGSALQGTSRAKWVLTESYFSMDATIPDLAAIASLCREHGAYLIVDEAHALGVFGNGGRGLAEAAGVLPDVLVGTFGKAFGVQGAFVAGSHTLRTYLWNCARSFVFSTAPSPALATTTRQRLDLLAAASEQRAHLRGLSSYLELRVRDMGLRVPEGRTGPIFPIILGSAEDAVRASEHLADAGILAPAIRPPTVPVTTSRVRISLTAAHTEADVERIAEALAPWVRR